MMWISSGSFPCSFLAQGGSSRRGFFLLLFLFALSTRRWVTENSSPSEAVGIFVGVLGGHITQFVVEAPDAEMRHSKVWKKLVRGYRELLDEESSRGDWIPVKGPSDDDDDDDAFSAVSLHAVARFPINSEVAAEEKLGSLLGRRLPDTLNSHFSLRQEGGRYMCQKSPWVVKVTVDRVSRAMGPGMVKYWDVTVQYDMGGKRGETAQEELLKLPTVLPLTLNNLIFKEGISEAESQPVEGTEATLACLKENSEVLFITDAEDDEEQHMPELQPGPWSARAQIYSVPDPLTPFGRKYHVGIIDNVAITMPPQKSIPLPPMRSLPSLELLLQLELASLQSMEGPGEENGGGRRKGGLGGAPCYLHRGALYSDPVRLDCRIWHDRSLKKPPLWKRALGMATPFLSVGVSAGWKAVKTDTRDYNRMVKVTVDEGKSELSDILRSHKLTGAALNVRANFGFQDIPESRKAVLERLSSQAVQSYASSYSEDTKEVGPFTFSPAAGRNPDGDRIKVTLDPNKLSSRDRSALGYAPGKTSQALTFELKGPQGANVFGRSGDNQENSSFLILGERDDTKRSSREKESSSSSAGSTESRGMLKSIYHATVTEPTREARKELWKGVAITAGTAALTAGVKFAFDWWKQRNDFKKKLKLIQIHRSQQKYVSKFRVKIASAEDRLLPEAPDDIMH
ncbi:hypothetical protein CSUI_005899 [Cystoisospora suis]|uniref:Transmembrane protein n=1 Tax=Cystoisospora suis TaxID=483139 RepID=A0A2C6KVW5_9APIC|nr:hypothetical protein CSUI_005899 [Cystoisospora suis]